MFKNVQDFKVPPPRCKWFFPLLRFHVTQSVSWLPKIRHNLPVPIFRGQQPKTTKLFDPTRWDPIGCPETSITTNLRWVKSQKSEYLILWCRWYRDVVISIDCALPRKCEVCYVTWRTHTTALQHCTVRSPSDKAQRVTNTRLQQGCTNTRRRVAVATNFRSVVPNVCRPPCLAQTCPAIYVTDNTRV